MANLKQLKKKAQQSRPAIRNIKDIKSLQDNFIYSLLINTKYGEQIQNYSPVELSKWLKEQPAIQSDYDIFKMLFDK